MSAGRQAADMVTRTEGLLGNLRSAVSQILGPPRVRPPQPPPRVVRPQPERAAEFAGPDVLSGVCNGIALRDLNLVDTLLAELERLEGSEEDPDALSDLYRLDHLATRLRRNAENLRVLSGQETTDEHGAETQHLVDVIRAGMSAIEQYARVTIGRVVSLGVVGFAADDLGRLLAELLDNATKSSPPLSPVRVSAHLTEAGSVLLRIEDEGIGLPPERLAGLNARLTTAPVLDRKAVQHMGLAVVGRLAHRHRMRVRLERRTPNGTIATVLVPTALVCDLPETSWSGGQTVGYPARYRRNAANAEPAATAEPVTGNGVHTANGLPRRRPVDAAPPAPSTSDTPGTASGEPPSASLSVPEATPDAEPEPVAPPSNPAAASTGHTANGLPRRVPTSLRKPGTVRKLEPPRAVHELAARQDTGVNHAQLLADLADFTDGERAARADQRGAETEASPDDRRPQPDDVDPAPTGSEPSRDHKPISEDSSDR